jgi:hypothetical protein
MDRLSQLAADLSSTLEELRQEAARRDARRLAAPLAWLDEANGWLRYELERTANPGLRDAVPFTYIPADLRR